MIEFVAPTREHCVELITNLRPGDRAEVEAVTGRLEPDDLWVTLPGQFECRTMLADGRVVCIFGVGPHDADDTVGVLWLLGTALLDPYMFSLGKAARRYIARWHERFDTLTNVTDKRNVRILRWLTWLGFTLGPEVPIGPHSLPFIQFLRVSPCAPL